MNFNTVSNFKGIAGSGADALRVRRFFFIEKT
jgi:hypothetical protein